MSSRRDPPRALSARPQVRPSHPLQGILGRSDPPAPAASSSLASSLPALLWIPFLFRSAHLLPGSAPRTLSLYYPSCPKLLIPSPLKSFLEKKSKRPTHSGGPAPPAPLPARRHLQVHGRELHPELGGGHLRRGRGGSWAPNSGRKLALPRPAPLRPLHLQSRSGPREAGHVIAAPLLGDGVRRRPPSSGFPAPAASEAVPAGGWRTLGFVSPRAQYLAWLVT